MKFTVKNRFTDKLTGKTLVAGDVFETDDKDRIEWALKANVIHADKKEEQSAPKVNSASSTKRPKGK